MGDCSSQGWWIQDVSILCQQQTDWLVSGIYDFLISFVNATSSQIMRCSIAIAYYLRNITMKCTTYIGCGVLSTTVVQSWQSILIDTNSTSTRSNKHIVKNHCSALKWQWILQYSKPAVDFFTRHAKTVVDLNQAGMSCYDIISLELSWSMLFIQRLYSKGLDELLTTKRLTQPWDLYQLHSTCSLWLNQGVKGIPEENR